MYLFKLNAGKFNVLSPPEIVCIYRITREDNSVFGFAKLRMSLTCLIKMARRDYGTIPYYSIPYSTARDMQDGSKIASV
eukprot:scaffold491_cov160-Amphora_coffeaeformis.AAC.2